ncbi:hypothetical protein [Hoylesella loescheii]|uniref:Uncharacterized protein n=1 Tax=Hoylesella loescheii DSM 19665 = JCM 12249 = ATCC 15930 TaxID=1122985 RepID=A0A069QGB6_HOYLO|nr:hypothetical protein [Hoylesella loescheii]KDR51913.1 hypothetical protein HMPREF1991_02010 [Hoylesella loescheii DSM 19665 = JCM 12249 = ATCC 15930]
MEKKKKAAKPIQPLSSSLCSTLHQFQQLITLHTYKLRLALKIALHNSKVFELINSKPYQLINPKTYKLKNL